MLECNLCISDKIRTECKNNKIIDSEGIGCI